MRDGKDQGDADYANAAREGSEQCAGLLGHQVVERKLQCGSHRHGFVAAPSGATAALSDGGRRIRHCSRHERIRVADDLAVGQPDYARRILFGKLGIVRDHDDETVFGYLLEDIHYLRTRLGIEGARRFVCEDYVWVIDESARDRDTLDLSAGHLGRLLVYLIAEADLLEGGDGALLSLFGRDAGKSQCEFNIGEHRLVRDQVIALEYEAYGVVSVCVPVCVLVFPGADAVDKQVSVGVLVETSEYVQHRCFAAA